ncbi:hypothetical protein KJ975_03085 [Myxococcota bacterium]|nr:hypothetical protein [Myxococcota bacterium]
MRIPSLMFVIVLAFSGAACDDGSKKTENNVNNINNVNNVNNVNNGYCGDGRILGVEECDDGNMASNDGCSSDCLWEYTCGDGVREFTEECDGEDFGESTCVAWGHAGGLLSCSAECTVDDSACEDTNVNLLGWYRMETMSAQEMNTADTNNMCVIHEYGQGAVLRGMPGRIGDSIFFDSTSDLRAYMDCGPGYEGTESLTVEAWIQATMIGMDLSMIVSSVESYEATGLGFYMALTPDFMLEAGVGDWDAAVVSTGMVPTGSWHHVAFTWDGTTLTLFVDGLPAGVSVDHPGGPVPVMTDSRFYVASNFLTGGTAENGHFFTGYLDEIKIWDVARTSVEICQDAGGVWFEEACIL